MTLINNFKVMLDVTDDVAFSDKPLCLKQGSPSLRVAMKLQRLLKRICRHLKKLMYSVDRQLKGSYWECSPHFLILRVGTATLRKRCLFNYFVACSISMLAGLDRYKLDNELSSNPRYGTEALYVRVQIRSNCVSCSRRYYIRPNNFYHVATY